MGRKAVSVHRVMGVCMAHLNNNNNNNKSNPNAIPLATLYSQHEEKKEIKEK